MAKTVKEADKERALAALLDSSTLTAAATAAGLDRKTLYNYLREDSKFAYEYKRQRQLRAIERAEQAAGEREAALQAIRSIMNDVEQPAAIRLKAAEKLLDVANDGFTRQACIAGDIWDVHSGFGFE